MEESDESPQLLPLRRRGTPPDPARRFVLPYRKHGDLMIGRTRETVFRAIRPTENVLAGYEPSYAMHRVLAGVG